MVMPSIDISKYHHQELTLAVPNITKDYIDNMLISDSSTSIFPTKLLNINQDELDKMCINCPSKIKCEISKQKPSNVKISLSPSPNHSDNLFIPHLKCEFLS